MAEINLDSLNVRRTLTVGGKEYDYFSLEAAEAAGIGAVSRLPYALKVVLENLLRHEDGENVTLDDVRALPAWLAGRRLEREIALRPARVVMPDSSGVAVLLELAAMRDAMAALGGDPARVNPKVPVDVIVDHSVIVDVAGQGDALARNMEIELDRNRERFAFLRWGQLAFDGVRVVPPGRGIIHQVNLEYLAQVVWTEEAGGRTLAYPDTLLGTDSHTPMINSLGVLGWGVGGLEGGATMLGQPVAMLLPEVVGCRLSGHLGEGVTTTDLVLRVTEVLRAHGVVGKFVEFFGPGVDALPLAERATLANMAPEYGATMGFFPIDRETVRYLELTGREPARVALVEAYAKAQGLWRETGAPDPDYTEVVDIDLGAVETSIAGPKRPQGPCAPEGRREPGCGDAGRARRHRHRRRRAGGERGPAAPWRHRPGRHHQLHQYLEPVGDGGRRAVGPKGGGTRPRGQALGQDLAGAGLARRRRLSRRGRPPGAARSARLPHRRLRLHHLHGKLRPPRRAGCDRHRRGRSRGRGRALGQPQLRGPDPQRDAPQLPGLAAAGGRLRHRRPHRHRTC